VIEILTDQHNLVFGLAFPLVIVKREAFAAEVEDVAARSAVVVAAFVKPEDTFGTKDRGRKLIVEKVLEFADGKGAIALKRN